MAFGQKRKVPKGLDLEVFSPRHDRVTQAENAMLEGIMGPRDHPKEWVNSARSSFSDLDDMSSVTTVFHQPLGPKEAVRTHHRKRNFMVIVRLCDLLLLERVSDVAVDAHGQKYSLYFEIDAPKYTMQRDKVYTTKLDLIQNDINLVYFHKQPESQFLMFYVADHPNSYLQEHPVKIRVYQGTG